jgi:hypothetical protein
MEVDEIMRERGFTAFSAATIYDECTTIWSSFQEISIEHMSRDANQVAHELDDDPPSFIIQFLYNDITIIN